MNNSDLFIDRSGWPAGEWDNERNFYEFKFEELDCLILRMPKMGHLCGYVKLPRQHPFYDNWNDWIDIDVHGGITYAQFTSEDDFIYKFMPETTDYWLGFDCGHSTDISPGIDSTVLREKYGITYKNVEFVKKQLANLASQLNTFFDLFKKHQDKIRLR